MAKTRRIVRRQCGDYQLYDLSQPGMYTISVEREFPPAQNLGVGSIKSNTITVTVTK
jgi:predicted DNA-binding transcriptional regulator AlpA